LAPPLGLLYIARKLENAKDIVEILDFSAEPYNEQKLKIKVKSADVVGISVLTMSLKTTAKIIQTIKQVNPKIPVVIGGPHCTLFPKRALTETNADICIPGDAENTILHIKKDLTKKVVKHRLVDINTVDFPARHLVQHYTYGLGFNPKMKPGQFTSIITTRGCPFNCRFCSRGSIRNQKFRTRSTVTILNELLEIKKMGYTHVAINDDCFPNNMQQAHHLFDALIKKNMNMKFYITAARVDSADETLYQKMKKAGVVHIQFGLESANQDVLDFYNKKITVEQIKKAVNLSHKIGFFTAGTFIFGAPFETKTHFEKTLQFAKSLPLDSVSFLPLRYMAGSELWSQAVEEGKISDDEYIVEAGCERNLSLFSQKEIIQFCKKAQRKFYMRPQFMFRLFCDSLKRNDLSYIQIYILIIVSYLKQTIKTLFNQHQFL